MGNSPSENKNTRFDGHLQLPHPRLLARYIIRNLVEGMLGPLGMFYLFLRLFGLRAGVIAALIWSYLALSRRLIRHERVTGLLMITVVGISVRSAISLAFPSAFLYFAQPLLSAAALGLVFVASVFVGRPLITRLAQDFCPLPNQLLKEHWSKQIFARLSLLWGVVWLTNAGLSLHLLVSSSTGNYIVLRSLLSTGLTAAAIAASVIWFIVTFRRAVPKARLSFAPRPTPTKSLELTSPTPGPMLDMSA